MFHFAFGWLLGFVMLLPSVDVLVFLFLLSLFSLDPFFLLHLMTTVWCYSEIIEIVWMFLAANTFRKNTHQFNVYKCTSICDDIWNARCCGCLCVFLLFSSSLSLFPTTHVFPSIHPKKLSLYLYEEKKVRFMFITWILS